MISVVRHQMDEHRRRLERRARWQSCAMVLYGMLIFVAALYVVAYSIITFWW